MPAVVILEQDIAGNRSFPVEDVPGGNQEVVGILDLADRWKSPVASMTMSAPKLTMS